MTPLLSTLLNALPACGLGPLLQAVMLNINSSITLLNIFTGFNFFITGFILKFLIIEKQRNAGYEAVAVRYFTNKKIVQ
jgi:hypothetical protein